MDGPELRQHIITKTRVNQKHNDIYIHTLLSTQNNTHIMYHHVIGC